MAQFQAAAAVADSINTKAAHIDQLSATYQTAVANVASAQAEHVRDQASLVMTRAAYVRVHALLSKAVVGAYTSGASSEQAAASFVPVGGQVTSAEMTSQYYMNLAAKRLSTLMAQAQQLVRTQGHLADASSAALQSAQTNAATAQQSLTQAQAEQAALSAQEATLQAGIATTMAQLAVLQAQAEQARVAGGGQGLRQGVATPPPVLGSASKAVAYALAQVGKPYLWGGTGPDSYDCSGLVMEAWMAAGAQLPRVADAQSTATIPLNLANLAPGDLVFFDSPVIGHVGMYLGNGLMVDAPHTGAFVRIESMYWPSLEGFGRVA